MLKFVCRSGQPAYNISVECGQVMKGAVIEKVLLHVLYDIFNFPLTLRIGFSAEMILKGPISYIVLKLGGQNNIATVLIADEDLVLIVNNFRRNAFDKAKGKFMSLNGSSGSIWPGAEVYILVPRSGKDHGKKVNL
ncbi:hypothetical protein GCM10008119_38240 [Pedobacter mendelii]|uniref:Uncharacterized protein n=1 Tax=Pedobacter mendelii TaxID=1908240 RepID=A0ABQ2BQ51_9SPHI|nr:hypothetical protein GCM10008119_38240 [Pedobacter mendelii]